MKAIAVLFLFIGMFMILQGYYSQQQNVQQESKIQIKFVPRTIYEEQLSDEDRVSLHFKSMFDDTQVIPSTRNE
jgi:hypothetical protein